MKDGYKLIAVGIVLTHNERIKRVEELNAIIDSFASAIHSSSDLDGMPHSTTVGDPVGVRAEQIEKIQRERDTEQERINAVEWAVQCISDCYDEEFVPAIMAALMTSFAGNNDKALNIITANTPIGVHNFYRAKRNFMQQINKYLYLK